MVTFVTAKEAWELLTEPAMAKAPFKVTLFSLMSRILKMLGSPAVVVQLMKFVVFATQNSVLEGEMNENVAKATEGKRATAATKDARIMRFSREC